MTRNLRALLNQFVTCLAACWILSIGNHAFSEERLNSDGPIDFGRELFEHKWKPNDELSSEGDGLGPLFNAKSCVECHNQGGTGGAGDKQHNVDILFLKTAEGSTAKKLRLERKLAGEIHPMFHSSNAILFHKDGTEIEYDYWRKSVLGKNASPYLHFAFNLKNTKKLKVEVLTQNGRHFIAIGQLTFEHLQRNSPSLFGSGLIDEIPQSKLEALQIAQEKSGGLITGRASTNTSFSINGGRAVVTQNVGKYGWRAQSQSLRQFVLGACANELGLHSNEVAQSVSPLSPSKAASSPDISDSQVEALVAYVRSLPPPEALTANSLAEAESWRRGEITFGSINCADCHVPTIHKAEGIYSDLLLHDMGDGLSDPLANIDSLYSCSTNSSPNSSTNPANEWRTPPLWGVRFSSPYLHDGRASSIQDAILAHGGEAQDSVQKFKKLSKRELTDLLAFIESLGAPPKRKEIAKRE